MKGGSDRLVQESFPEPISIYSEETVLPTGVQFKITREISAGL